MAESPSPLGRLLARLGPEVDDPDEETFLLFAHDRPLAQNLGFIDAHAPVLDIAVAGRDLTIHQSPAVLASNRSGGTTGAVLWKISPAVAEWLAHPDNLFFSQGGPGRDAGAVLGPHSAVLELGCGIAGVIGLTLTGKGSASSGGSTKKKGPRTAAGARRRPGRSSPAPGAAAAAANTVGRYVLTDQPYVAKFLLRNLEENATAATAAAAASPVSQRKPLFFRPLDWESDQITAAILLADGERRGSPSPGAGDAGPPASFDAVLACDCIYNEALVAPLVQTLADACRLRPGAPAASRPQPPTLCIVAQQLRDPDVLAAWLAEFHSVFRVWRIPDDLLTPGLRPAAGFALHVGLLRAGQAA